MPPDQLAMAKQLAEVTVLSAAPAGMAISLVASLVLVRGPRQRIAFAMIALALTIVATAYFDQTLQLGHRGEMLAFSLLWAGFIFLGLVSLVFWPVGKRWINWPLVIGTGISLSAAVAHQSLMLWSSWLVSA